MTGDRISVFENTGDLDLSTFKPQQKSRKLKPPKEQVQAVSEAARFPSREARPSAAEPSNPPPVTSPWKQKPHWHKTGRVTQLNVRVMPESHAKVYAISERQGWLVGETIERAIEALEREIGKREGEGT
jgi:hypothetical protein